MLVIHITSRHAICPVSDYLHIGKAYAAQSTPDTCTLLVARRSYRYCSLQKATLDHFVCDNHDREFFAGQVFSLHRESMHINANSSLLRDTDICHDSLPTVELRSFMRSRANTGRKRLQAHSLVQEYAQLASLLLAL